MPLTPEEQSLFQQLQAKSQQGQAPMQGPASTQEPAPGSFKDDPEGAMRYIAQRASGPQLRQGPNGLNARVPVDQPLLRLFGAKKNVPVGPDYFQSIQQAGMTDYIPQGVPRTPEGQPFISEKTSDQIKQLASQKKQAALDAPSREWGEAMKSKALEIYGPESDRYKSFAAAVDASGGISVGKLAEVSSALITPTKQGDIFKGEDGRTYFYDRGSETAKPILGNVGGVLSSFNPLELGIVKSEMKGFDNDPVVKEARKQLASLTSISALVESRNPASLGILAGNIAKGLGKEAGALTNEDIARATGSQQLGDRWKRFWAKHVNGQLSDTDVADYQGLLADINRAAQKQIGNAADSRTKRLSKILKRNPEELKDIVTFGTEFMPAEEKSEPVSSGPLTADRVPQVKEGQTKSGVKFKVIK